MIHSNVFLLVIFFKGRKQKDIYLRQKTARIVIVITFFQIMKNNLRLIRLMVLHVQKTIIRILTLRIPTIQMINFLELTEIQKIRKKAVIKECL